jgi:hypothetical protein
MTRIRPRAKLGVAATTCLLIASMAVAAAPTAAHAGHAMTVTLFSPSIGLTKGQTARLGVVNDTSSSVSETLSIIDGAGATLATKTLSIAAGHNGRIDLIGTTGRIEVHGGIGSTALPATLQVFDTSSKQTQALVEFPPGPPITT